MTRLVFGNTNNLPPQARGNDSDTPDGLFNRLNNAVEGAQHATSDWSDKQAKFHRLRMRIKKKKTFPFKDSSNIRMPTAEINIRKIKAGVMSAVFGIRPVVQALPGPRGDLETAQKIEKFMDHMVMEMIRLDEKAEVGVDQSLEKGFYMAKVYHRLEIIDREEEVDLMDMRVDDVLTIFNSSIEEIMPFIVEQFDIDTNENVLDDNLREVERGVEDILSGKTKVTLKLRDVVYNLPDVDFISPERVYVPSDSGFDVQKCSTVTVETFLPLDMVKRNAVDKGWDSEVVSDLEAFQDMNIDHTTDIEKDFREGVERMQNPSELVRVWETFGWIDIDGDGVKEKALVTSFPDFRKVARKVLLEQHSGEFPLVKLFYEMTDDRWFSHRGIPELLEDIIKEIDVQHNMKIDYQTLNNAPMLLYRAGMVNPRLARVNPAAAIPVQGTMPLNDAVTAVNLHNPNAELSYEREQMILETKIQEMVGQVDFSLQSLINRRQPRTLGEVEQQQQQSNRVFSLDVKHYTASFSKIFQMLFEHWIQFGDDEYEFKYFGESVKGETIRLSKEEIQGRYKIVVRGNDQNTNPNIKLQKAQQILAAVTNPLFIQTGIIGPQNIANGLKRFFQAMDINEFDEIINVNPPQPEPPDPKTGIQVDFDELTDSEKAQVLASQGIQPDGGERLSKKQMERLEMAADIANKVN